MADHAQDHSHGHMDIRQQESTFHLFLKMTKWGALHVAVIVLFATLWFCTDAGFFGALIAALVVLVLGILLLRERRTPSAAH